MGTCIAASPPDLHPAGSLDKSLISDDTRLRVLHAAPNAQALDVYLTATDADLANASPRYSWTLPFAPVHSRWGRGKAASGGAAWGQCVANVWPMAQGS